VSISMGESTMTQMNRRQKNTKSDKVGFGFSGNWKTEKLHWRLCFAHFFKLVEKFNRCLGFMERDVEVDWKVKPRFDSDIPSNL